MDTLWQDLRFALRTLRRSLAVTVLATTSLGLAIAGNVTVFSLINGLLYRPLPYEEPTRLSLVGERALDLPRGQLSPSSAANFIDWSQRQGSFSQMAALRPSSFSFDRGGDQPEQFQAAVVSPNFFEVLGVAPQLGRPFLAEEGVPGRERVAVLSHKFWAERLSSRADIVGEKLLLNGEPYDVVGVLKEDFDFLDPSLQLYVPLAQDSANLERHHRDLFAFARLEPGVTDRQAQIEMTAIMQQLAEEYPEANRGYTVDVLNLREEIPDPNNRRFFALLQGAMVFVLLIACANIANLLLARSQSREREIAIRTSLGASRRRISRQLFTESLVMALIAGSLGLGLTALGVRLIGNALAAILPRYNHPVIDVRVLGFSLAVTLLGGVLFGLVPVIQTLRVRLLGALKDGTQAATSSKGRRLVASTLVVVELALALVLLGGTSVMLSSFATLQKIDPGFATPDLLTVQLSLPDSRYGTSERLIAGVEELQESLARLPGVRGVIVSNAMLRTPFPPREIFSLDAEPTALDQPQPRATWMTANAGYFELLGINVLQGQVFSAAQSADTSAVAVINQAMANRFWGDESPLGQRMTMLGSSREIIGVVGDVRHNIAIKSESEPTVYLPWVQQPLAAVNVTLRTDVEAQSLTDAVRNTIMSFDADLAISPIRTLEAHVEQFFVGQHVFSAILRGFGGLALLLAAVGTYGVLAFSVVQRTHEIGVRIAIGADRGQVVQMITRQGLILAVLGILLGIPGVLAVNRLIESVLENSVPVETGAALVSILVLTGVILLASFLPARRAASVDPIEALRWE